MAEATEEVKTEQAEASTEATAASVDESTETSAETESVGADDPTSGKAVYERKMHRRAVQAEREAADLRERMARLEGELQARREQPAEPAKKEPTIAEVVQAMEAGTITAAAGAAYIAKKTSEDEFRKREERERSEKPIQTAAQQIEEYKQLLPGLGNQSHARFGEVRSEYQRLVNTLGLPQNTATELLAVEHVFGKIDQIKAKRNMDKTDREGARFHSERGGGGSSETDKKQDWSKAGKDQIAYWDRRGVSEADRAKEWGYIQARAARKGRAA